MKRLFAVILSLSILMTSCLRSAESENQDSVIAENTESVQDETEETEYSELVRDLLLLKEEQENEQSAAESELTAEDEAEEAARIAAEKAEAEEAARIAAEQAEAEEAARIAAEKAEAEEAARIAAEKAEAEEAARIAAEQAAAEQAAAEQAAAEAAYTWGEAENVSDGTSYESEWQETVEREYYDCEFVVNTNSRKFHRPTCGSVELIENWNIMLSNETAEELIDESYRPCETCLPEYQTYYSELTAEGYEDGYTYVLNVSSMKIHTPHCSRVNSMSESNKAYTNETLEELYAQGYTDCGTCNPSKN